MRTVFRRWAEPVDRARVLAPVAAAIFIVATLVGWVRLGPTVRSTLWAEDGGAFYRDRVALGPIDSLLHPYAGYLHLVPRLITDVASAGPIDRYALTMALLSCGVVGGVCASLFLLSKDLIRPLPLRLLVAAAPLFLPTAPIEIAGDSANLHWYMLFLAPWVFMARPRSWTTAGVIAALAIPVTLTEVQTLMFAPLLVMAWLPLDSDTGRSRSVTLRALPVTVVALAGMALQVRTTLDAPRPGAQSGAGVRDLLAGYLMQPFSSMWTEHLAAVGRLVVAHGWAVVLVPAAVTAAALVAAVVVGRWRARVMIVALTGASGVVWSASVIVNAAADRHWATGPVAALATATSMRYGAAGSLLLTGAFIVAAAVFVERTRQASWFRRGVVGTVAGRVAACLGWCMAALLVVVFVVNFTPVGQTRRNGPVWSTQFTTNVREYCRSHPHGTVQLKTAPWGTAVGCDRVNQLG